MKFESYLLEFLGLVAIAGSSALLTQIVTITPYNMEQSRAQNNVYFCAIPVSVYLLYRVYFGLIFYLNSFLPKQLKPFDWYMSTILISVGLGAGFYAPTVKPTLTALFEYYAGDVIAVLSKAGKPELERNYNFGLRVVSLIAAWFLVLFVVELLIRVVLYGIVSVFRAVGVMPKLKKLDSVDGAEDVGAAEVSSASD